MKETLFVLFALILTTSISGQGIDDLKLSPLSNSNQNVFQLIISRKEANKILSSSGKKFNIKDPILIFNGDTLNPVSIKTRGKTSLTFRRKSLSVSLEKPISVNGVNIKKFVLLALQMDKNYWRNRLSFILMNNIDLFPLTNMYTELKINDGSQGIYLFVHKSDDFTKQIGSPILIRRVVEGNFQIDYKKGDEGADLWKDFQKGRSLPNKYKGQELSKAIMQILDLNQYFQWLAFNFLVMNGDYADEVFYYYENSKKQFRIIPWDYDDIFSSGPHEGWEMRKLTIDHALLFSGEAYFDRVIDKDEYLYALYIEEFQKLIKTVNPEIIKSAFEEVYEELYPYYIQPDIIHQSEHDAYGPTNLVNLQKDLITHYQFLIQRYLTIINTIEEK